MLGGQQTPQRLHLPPIAGLSASQDCLGIKLEICARQRPSTQKGPSPAEALSSSSPSCGLLLSRNAGDALACSCWSATSSSSWNAVGRRALKEPTLMQVVKQQRHLGHSESLPVCRVDLKHHPQVNRKANKHTDWPYSSSLFFLFPLCENQFMAAV